MKSFSSNVLIGNWWEERILKSDLKSSSSESTNNVLCASDVIKNLCQGSCEEIETRPGVRDGYIKYGCNIQLLNQGTDPYYLRTGLSPPREPYVISLGIDRKTNFQLMYKSFKEKVFDHLSQNNELVIGATSTIKPAIRNIFQIISPQGYGENTLVRYGEPVQFVVKPDMVFNQGGTKPLYLASQYDQIGDVNIKYGAQKLLIEANDPTYASFWRLELADPFYRDEYEGKPVKFNEKLLIKHMQTNRAIALEHDFMKRTLFSCDVDVSARTYYDAHRLERDVNIWVLHCPQFSGSSTTNS